MRTDGTLEAVREWIESQVGYVEGGGPDGKSGNLTKYGDWYGLDGQPWCAMGLSWCFFHAGLPLPASTSKGFAYTPSGANWFKENGWWHTKPKVGDVVFFSYGGKRIDHVGWVDEVHSDGTLTVAQIATIEFNTLRPGASGSERNGGGCYERVRRDKIVGYGRPRYKTRATSTEDNMPLYIIECREHPGGQYLTDRATFVRTMSPAAKKHGQNLGWYPKDSSVEAVPHDLINWLDQVQDDHHNPGGV